MLRVSELFRFTQTVFFLFSFLFCSSSWSGGYDGTTPLENPHNEHEFLAACRTGNIEAVNFFLQMDDFDIDSKFESGVEAGTLVTGLYIATQENKPEVVSHLIYENADVNMGRSDGTSPLFIATQLHHRDLVSIFLADVLIDIDQANDIGVSPIHVAAKTGNVEIIGMLLDAKVNMNRLYNGLSPARIAYNNKCIKAYDLLIEYGAETYPPLASPVRLDHNAGFVNSIALECVKNDVQVVDQETSSESRSWLRSNSLPTLPLKQVAD